MAEWRENNWQWEHYGEMLPVKNADLWQRLDRALEIHDVQWRTLRFDAPHVDPRKFWETRGPTRPTTEQGMAQDCVQRAGQWMRGWLNRSRVRAAQLL